MKIVVDRELCEGNARCVRAAPTVFDVGDDDLVVVKIAEPGPELRDAVERAVELCPRQALSIRE